ncbi:Crp/Fnr family transcriptional regulator [uncultured Ferrovibrio sp.]|jgi:cAMP-binding proteins - catabolite gene activator and regulatory subunit of cAMP-dependent protein kinases|uniref:Crp/Fnr family transcriptional regulator n=1 Tax=uncultured Ferrovibrio sp. TaxID=1576913 RepID=UPI00260AC7BA|nr:Crp/Fnr family transcriptional regulator [uncultured Ferrovibrio sp.]
MVVQSGNTATGSVGAGKGKMPQPGSDSLERIELLSELSPAARLEVERSCQWRRFAAGEQILDRNSDSRDVYFVVEGSVEVVNFSGNGREISYAIVPAGGYFGEIAAIDGERRSASVVAQTACRLASLPPKAFEALLAREPSVALKVMRRLTGIIRTNNERIMDLATLGAIQRVYRELLKMARPDPINAGGWMIYPMPKQHEIARRAATTRETVARVLANLLHGGQMVRRDKTYYLTDRAVLEQAIVRLDVRQQPSLS